MLKVRTKSPSGTELESLIKAVSDFHSLEINDDVGPGLVQARPVFHLIFKATKLASRFQFSNFLMISATILAYNGIRVPKKGVKIFQYGLTPNNLLAFKRLKEVLDAPVQTTICINGRSLSFAERAKLVLSRGALWKSAGLLTRHRNSDALVHIQSVLAIAALNVFHFRPLDPELRVVCVASDHSPISMALVFFARSEHIATCYLQHAPVTEYFPALNYDLSILYDRASRDAYALSAVRANVEFNDNKIAFLPPFSKPFRQPEVPSRPLRVGICLSYLPEMSTLKTVIEALVERGDVSRVLLRRHPRCRIDWSSLASLNKVELRPQGESLLDFVVDVDIALVSNSGAVIETLHYGLPTFYLNDADVFPKDYYGFVSSGVLPEFSDEVLQDPAAYFDAKWRKRFRKYDETVASDLAILSGDVRRKFMDLYQDEVSH